MTELLSMHGYGAYVWSSVFLVAGALTYEGVKAYRLKKSALLKFDMNKEK